MKQLTLKISDNKFQTFLEFIKKLDYVEVHEADQSFAEMRNSIKQVRMMQDGTIEKQMDKDFLNEL